MVRALGSLCVALLVGGAACPGVVETDAGDGAPGGELDAGARSDAGTTDGGSGPCLAITVAAPGGPGHLYVDGVYAGRSSAEPLPPPAVGARVAVGSEAGYFEALFEGDPPGCRLELDAPHRVPARPWTALYVELERVTDGNCETAFAPGELDALFAFFETSLRVLEEDSMGLIEWTVERVSIPELVALDLTPGYPTIEPVGLDPVQGLEPGDVDNIFVVFKGMSELCEIPAPYFGLAWGPEPATREAGFTVVQIPDPDVIGLLSYLSASDPGVFVHEWEHTAVENHFGPLVAATPGVALPSPGDDGSVVHNAEAYGYAAPWMTWYQDLLGGRVADPGSPLGVGPDVMRLCSIVDRANGACP